MDGGDWRTQLRADLRQRIVNKIMGTLKRHLPFPGQDGLHELKKTAVRFEENIYSAASSQSDYLHKLSLTLLSVEPKSQNTEMSNPIQPNPPAGCNNTPDPAVKSPRKRPAPILILPTHADTDLRATEAEGIDNTGSGVLVGPARVSERAEEELACSRVDSVLLSPRHAIEGSFSLSGCFPEYELISEDEADSDPEAAAENKVTRRRAWRNIKVLITRTPLGELGDRMNRLRQLFMNLGAGGFDYRTIHSAVKNIITERERMEAWSASLTKSESKAKLVELALQEMDHQKEEETKLKAVAAEKAAAVYQLRQQLGVAKGEAAEALAMAERARKGGEDIGSKVDELLTEREAEADHLSELRKAVHISRRWMADLEQTIEHTLL